MGLRRTTTTSVPLQFRSIRRSAAGAVSPSQEKVVEAAASTTTAPVQVVLSSSATSSRARRSAAGGGGAQAAVDDRDRIAATKPPRALSTRTRHSRKGVGLAAAASSATATAAASPGPGVADPSRDPQDGMAPALTEPTAVPTQAANTKGQDASGGDSPQPEIFEVADHHPMAAGDHEHVAGTETSNSKMGLGGGERERQPIKAPKRTKKDELPLKELRSTRRRSNLQSPGASVTPARPVNGKSPRVPSQQQQKQKEQKERWVGTTGGNGGTVKATAPVVDVPVALENVKSRKKEAAVENSKEETTPPSSNSGPSEEGTRQENGQAGEKEVVQDSFVNTTETREEDPPVVRPAETDSVQEERLMEPSSMDQEEEEVVVNNNNYLDKNRVPIIMNSAVKEEGDEGQGVDEEKIGDTTTTTTNGPESNSEPPPVIQRAEEEEQQQEEVDHQEQGEDVPHTLEGGVVVREESTQPVVEEAEPMVEVQGKQGQGESGCVVSEEQVWTRPSEVDQVQVQQGTEQEELRVPPIIPPDTTTDPEPASTEPEPNIPSDPSNEPSDNSLDTLTPLLPLLLPQDANPCSAVEQFKAMSSDAALLEELLLTTPTKKLTEQLCMVLKDQERALDQQEQEEQQAQQQSSSSLPSSQTILKETAEMEEMLGALAATSELDLLQVFKSFESGPVTADDVATGPEGNLLSLLVAEDDDVDMMMSANESPVKCLPPLVNSSAAPARVSAADKEAQNQEQDMKERKKMLSEMEQELSQMQRRRDFLLRRLRKQQVHHMGRQLSEEVVGLFELSARAASSTAPPPVRTVTATDNNQVKYLSSAAPSASQNIHMEDVEEMTPASIVMRTDSPPSRADVKARLDKTAVGHHPFIKPPSPKSIRTFVQKVVASQVKEQPGTTNPVATGSNSNNIKSSSNKVGRPPTLVLPSFSSATASSMLDDGHRLQLTSNVGLLKTELRIVEQAIDSEATASSSGGESADELINYSNVVQESLAM